MKIENDIKILERGDKIRCKSILAEIATIHYQDYDRRDDTFVAEFYDIYGNIRNWHQSIDGGVVIPKAPTKNIYVGFEKTDTNGDDNFNNYNALQIFENENDAIEWTTENIKYRKYKYCGQIEV